jgi:hypothetical protein
MKARRPMLAPTPMPAFSALLRPAEVVDGSLPMLVENAVTVAVGLGCAELVKEVCSVVVGGAVKDPSD